MLIPVDQLHESPLNTRKLFGDLSELAASIKSKGVLQSVLVRPQGKGAFEIVAGHRRVRAAKLAGLEMVPADVRDLTDDEVVEISVIENSQRKDINPVEEGSGYLQLHEKHGRTVAEIAAKVGRSESHVYQRMALVDLPKDALDALAGGQLQVSVALALARLPDPKVRTAAAKEVLEGREVWDGAERSREPLPVRDALRLIREEFNLRLGDGCGFSLEAEDLVPSAGSCARCPKRSLNNPVLFPDLDKGEDLCTDPGCFAKKKEAGWKRRKAELEAAGRKVLEGKAAEAVVGEYGQCRSGFMKLTDHNYNDPKGRTAAQILGKKAAEEHLVVAKGKDGKVYEVVPGPVVAAALKKKLEEAGLKSIAATKQAPKLTDEQKAEHAKAQLEGRARELALDRTIFECVLKAQDAPADQVLQLVAQLFLSTWTDFDDVARRRALAPDELLGDPEFDASKVLGEELERLDSYGKRGLALELALCNANAFESYGGGPKTVDAACQALGIDAKRRKELTKEGLEMAKREAAEKKAERKGAR